MKRVKANHPFEFCTAKRRDKKESQAQQKRALIFMQNRQDYNLARIIDPIFDELKINLERLISELRTAYPQKQYRGNFSSGLNSMYPKENTDAMHTVIDCLNDMHGMVFSRECYVRFKQEVLTELYERCISPFNITKAIEDEIYDHICNQVFVDADDAVIENKVEVLEDLKRAMQQEEEPISDIIMKLIEEIKRVKRLTNGESSCEQFIPFSNP